MIQHPEGHTTAATTELTFGTFVVANRETLKVLYVHQPAVDHGIVLLSDSDETPQLQRRAASYQWTLAPQDHIDAFHGDRARRAAVIGLRTLIGLIEQGFIGSAHDVPGPAAQVYVANPDDLVGLAGRFHTDIRTGASGRQYVDVHLGSVYVTFQAAAPAPEAPPVIAGSDVPHRGAGITHDDHKQCSCEPHPIFGHKDACAYRGTGALVKE
jgi:hypothetical protein